MINLRYHIVSLTAVFLAIGIGLTLGSTFLDRATVENLNGQLESLDTRLKNREQQIADLEDELERDAAVMAALDEQATGLLTGALDGVPVVVMATRGVAESEVQAAVTTLVTADADVQGIWWFTERWDLDDDEEVTALSTVLSADSSDPSRLRRTAISRLGAELRLRQSRGLTEEPTEGEGGEERVETGENEEASTGSGSETDEQSPEEGGATDPTTAEPDGEDAVEIVDGLVEAGFIEFEPVSAGPDVPRFPAGARTVFAAGSSEVPDDLVFEPLIARIARVADGPMLGVVASAIDGEGAVADAVSVVRQDETLVDLVATVDSLDHFPSWAAMVLALADVGDGAVGHYGLDEGASGLLPPLRSP